MKTLILASLAIICSCSKEKTTKPPLASSVMAVDEYHGQKVEDPYRNLENLKDSTIIGWYRQQGTYAFDVLKKIPGRQKIIDQQLKYDVDKAFSVSSIKPNTDGTYFYLKRLAKEDVDKLYYRPGLNSDEILLFDPSTYGDKEEYHINHQKSDWKGEKVAVCLSKKGDETSEIIVIDVPAQKVLPGVIKNATSGIQWLSDNSGFLYQHSPVNDPTDPKYHMNAKVILHELDDDVNQLNDVYSRVNNPELKLNPEDYPYIVNYDPNDGYLFAGVGGSSLFQDMYYKEETQLTTNKSWKLLYTKEDKVDKIRVYKDSFVFLSAKDASNFRICKTSLKKPDFKNPEVLVPEQENRLVLDFEVTKDGLFYTTMKNGVESKLYALKNGEETEILLPKPSGNTKIASLGTKYSFLRVSTVGYLNPDTDFLYDYSSNTFKEEGVKPLINYPELDELVAEQIEVPSHDGALVPVSVIRHKDTKKDGSNLTLFYGYGAYGGKGSVSFNPNFLTWVLEGGILVFSYVRGGAQKGEAWHKAGFKTTKPNTWKDMIATTEYMIKEGYTTPENSAIWGSSAGGIMAGRAMTDRPDLYRAVILTVPATNLVRSEIQPNGQNSIKEFGTVEIKEEFEALLEMDSYHHLEEGVEYPATLVTSGMKDGRVVVWDPAKFAARLQASNASKHPILFAVSFDDGHGAAGNTLLEYYAKYAEALAFAFWQLGHPDYQIKQ